MRSLVQVGLNPASLSVAEYIDRSLRPSGSATPESQAPQTSMVCGIGAGKKEARVKRGESVTEGSVRGPHPPAGFDESLVRKVAAIKGTESGAWRSPEMVLHRSRSRHG